jgi:hypothetical protein
VNPADPLKGAFYTLDLPAAIITCSAAITMPSTPTTAPVNPKTLYWTQDELPGQVCKADLSGQTAFIALPAGGPYPFAVVTSNEAGVSPRGVGADPFRRVDPATAAKSVIMIK